MRSLNRILGLLVALIGVGFAGWAPSAFELLSGRTLPVPVTTDQAAMAIWSGVAFVRVFGAALLGLGAALWANNSRLPQPRVTQTVLFVSFVFAGLIVWAQQVAIWANAVGWALVVLFFALAAISGIGLMRATPQAVSRAAV